jgi:hypothetical protein
MRIEDNLITAGKKQNTIVPINNVQVYSTSNLTKARQVTRSHVRVEFVVLPQKRVMITSYFVSSLQAQSWQHLRSPKSQQGPAPNCALKRKSFFWAHDDKFRALFNTQGDLIHFNPKKYIYTDIF